MRESILDIEEEAYFSSILIVQEKGQRYTVFCDASNDGLGCVLMQSGRAVAYGF